MIGVYSPNSIKLSEGDKFQVFTRVSSLYQKPSVPRQIAPPQQYVGEWEGGQPFGGTVYGLTIGKDGECQTFIDFHSGGYQQSTGHCTITGHNLFAEMTAARGGVTIPGAPLLTIKGLFSKSGLFIKQPAEGLVSMYLQKSRHQ